MKEKLLNKVENIVTKGEIACFEQFLLSSQCFQWSSAAMALESVSMWERVNLGFWSSIKGHHNFSECFNLITQIDFSIIIHFTSTLHTDAILSICCSWLLKTMWQNKTFLIMIENYISIYLDSYIFCGEMFSMPSAAITFYVGKD